jgi:hypothetical protein
VVEIKCAVILSTVVLVVDFSFMLNKEVRANYYYTKHSGVEGSVESTVIVVCKARIITMTRPLREFIRQERRKQRFSLTHKLIQ